MTTPQNTGASTTGANPLAGVELSFVGAGVMAEAMIAGLLKQQLVTAAQVSGSHPRPARRAELAERYGIRMVEGNRDAARAWRPSRASCCTRPSCARCRTRPRRSALA